MRVIATKRGYHGGLREPGDEFEVGDKEKASWFEPVEGERKPRASRQPQNQTQGEGADLT